MASVVLLKGMNVGGHRRFRPSVLATELRRFGAVNIGAAGTFVIRKTVGRAALRTEIARRLPFEAEVMICDGGEILRLVSRDPFAGQPSRPNLIRFVSVLARRRKLPAALPMNLPSSGEWCVRVLAHDGRFVVGLHRRQMKAIGYLGQLEQVFGAPVTTRGWNTVLAIARILEDVDHGA